MDDQMQQDTQYWTGKLVGKKIGDDHGESTFAKRELPKTHRVLFWNTPATKDYRPERLNVHVSDDSVCTHVTMG